MFGLVLPACLNYGKRFLNPPERFFYQRLEISARRRQAWIDGVVHIDKSTYGNQEIRTECGFPTRQGSGMLPPPYRLSPRKDGRDERGRGRVRRWSLWMKAARARR